MIERTKWQARIPPTTDQSRPPTHEATRVAASRAEALIDLLTPQCDAEMATAPAEAHFVLIVAVRMDQDTHYVVHAVGDGSTHVTRSMLKTADQLYDQVRGSR